MITLTQVNFETPSWATRQKWEYLFNSSLDNISLLFVAISLFWQNQYRFNKILLKLTTSILRVSFSVAWLPKVYTKLYLQTLTKTFSSPLKQIIEAFRQQKLIICGEKKLTWGEETKWNLPTFISDISKSVTRSYLFATF